VYGGRREKDKAHMKVKTEGLCEIQVEKRAGNLKRGTFFGVWGGWLFFFGVFLGWRKKGGARNKKAKVQAPALQGPCQGPGEVCSTVPG